ncbi:hypothetical protein [Dactylosporangium sp. NPDC000521]|uniref:hypothetical protein n=1 Tax=Dactylosporangium sp. NPDC000521 TaxID=3363975 RepID=UPI0036739B48
MHGSAGQGQVEVHPRSPGRPETQAALRAYIEDIVRDLDRTGVGQYKICPDAIWTARGDPDPDERRTVHHRAAGKSRPSDLQRAMEGGRNH